MRFKKNVSETIRALLCSSPITVKDKLQAAQLNSLLEELLDDCTIVCKPDHSYKITEDPSEVVTIVEKSDNLRYFTFNVQQVQFYVNCIKEQYGRGKLTAFPIQQNRIDDKGFVKDVHIEEFKSLVALAGFKTIQLINEINLVKPKFDDVNPDEILE